MTRKKSIVVLTLLAVFIVLMTVFAVVEFPIGLYDYTGYAKTIKLGLDLSGGVSAVFVVDEEPSDDLQTRIDGTVQGLQSLLVSKGYTESVVSYANGKIRVEVPDIDDPEQVLELIGRPQSLEFRDGDTATAKTLIVGRDHIENAYVTYDENGNYAVGLKFNSEGTKVFADVTANYKKIYIYANNELYTTVSVNSAITDGKCIITSSAGYSYDDAYDFVTQIQSGTFSVTLVKDEIRTISATLGEGAIKSALIAAAIGVAIVFIFMAVIYRISGLAADIALFIYILLLLWFCSVLPWVQLTLPGIAGLVLSIGMAVDGNVVIFERIKDEYKHSSKPISTCVKTGFKRSLGAIIDGNVTTLIGAIVLWVVGSAAISGFAITLFIGIILSMFTSLLVTRLLMNIMLSFNSKNEKLYALKRSPEIAEELENGNRTVEDEIEGETEETEKVVEEGDYEEEK